jgi:intergrase/recombinase
MPADIIEHYKFNVDTLLQEFEQKNEIVKEELRNELIKMLKSEKFQLAYGVVPDEYAVDEYLKTKP